MTKHVVPTGLGCDMVRDCPRAWVEFVASDKRTNRTLSIRASCRQHATTAIAYMQTIPNARIEVRIAR